MIPGLYADLKKHVDQEVQADPSKFKWNNTIKVIFWNILCIEWEMAQMDNDTKLISLI